LEVGVDERTGLRTSCFITGLYFFMGVGFLGLISERTDFLMDRFDSDLAGVGSDSLALAAGAFIKGTSLTFGDL
jgi:hypothetical protein